MKMSRQEMKDEQFIKFQDEFYNLANGLSQGEAETRIIKDKN